MAEAYPTPLAGQRLTATLLRSMLPQTARKTSDTARSATSTPAADPHLVFDVAAGAAYRVHGCIKYDGPSAADLSVDWTVPTGSTGFWTGWAAGHSPVITFSNTGVAQTDTQGSRGYPIRVETNDISQNRTFGCLGVTNNPLSLIIYGMIRVGSTGGTYSCDWSQSTSDAGAVTVYTDSWLELVRVA